jgi:MFS family permease
LLLTPFALAIGVVAPIAGSMADRDGSRWFAPIGLVIATGGLLLLARLDETSSMWDVAWRLVVVGIGQGLFQSPNTRALMSAAPVTEQGEASGLLAMARVSGQALSVGVSGAVFASLGGAAAGTALLTIRAHSSQLNVAEPPVLQVTFVHGFQVAFTVCAGFAAVGALTALVRGQERRSSTARH